MRFLAMHKADPSYEAGDPPNPAAIERINQFIGEAMKAGVFVGGDGLHRSAQRVRLRFSAGKPSITRGPYAGENELPANFFTIKTKTMDDAISWATRLGKILGDAELELGPMVEGWDSGFMPKPEGEVPLRCLLTQKATPAYERGERPSKKVAEQLSALKEEMKSAGVLISLIELAPSKAGARLQASGGKKKVLDGPFAESKEMIAGFSVLEVSSLDEVIEWSVRFMKTFDPELMATIEVDVREVESAQSY